ncbi:hypothetical protein [Nocardioides szechwanensis]|uniref:hypothetical protein n=1 Tax=Nocardioides szechwanensis TaxID=1005944 RepID=UPI000B849481|nr:hypothetical protein [Nocardioides szechwanensis]
MSRGLYVPANRPKVVEQRIVEQAARLLSDATAGCVTAWAALRWHGANFFDGLDNDGVTLLPVPMVLGGGGHKLRQVAGSHVSREQLPWNDREVVDGVPVTTVARALFDEVHRRGRLWPAVSAIDMAAAAGLISVWLFATYVGNMNSRNGAPLAREACSLAVDESRSPLETWLRLIWLILAGLPEPLVNHPVYDLDGRLLGIPDLFDPIAGLVVEYDGAHHTIGDQPLRDLVREERFRDHGLEYIAIVKGQSRAAVARRLVAARARAPFRPPPSRAWTVDRPAWDPEPENLTARLERLGLAPYLTGESTERNRPGSWAEGAKTFRTFRGSQPA